MTVAIISPREFDLEDARSMANDRSTTRVLLSRWHGGDEVARDELLARHLDWIRLRVHERLGPELKARAATGDYVHDVACEVLQYMPRFLVEDGDRFRALICRIVENVLRDRSDWYAAKRRSRSRERPLPSDTVLHLDPPRNRVATPTTDADRREREAWVRLGLELLSEIDRAVLVKREWEGETFAVIGSQLGMSTDAAERRYKKAFERLAIKVKALRRGDLDHAIEEISREGR